MKRKIGPALLLILTLVLVGLGLCLPTLSARWQDRELGEKVETLKTQPLEFRQTDSLMESLHMMSAAENYVEVTPEAMERTADQVYINATDALFQLQEELGIVIVKENEFWASDAIPLYSFSKNGKILFFWQYHFGNKNSEISVGIDDKTGKMLSLRVLHGEIYSPNEDELADEDAGWQELLSDQDLFGERLSRFLGVYYGLEIADTYGNTIVLEDKDGARVHILYELSQDGFSFGT